jgi:hypothetical protein
MVPALAAFQRGAPAIDSRLHVAVLGIDDQDCRENGQHAACDNSLDDVGGEGPPESQGA